VSKPLLYLASQSVSRQELLRQAEIPFFVLSLDVDEGAVQVSSNDVYAYVAAVAAYKMAHVDATCLLSDASVVVLTADTLIRTMETKELLGKPDNYVQARIMLATQCTQDIEIITAHYLRLYRYDVDKGAHIIHTDTTWQSTATARFCVPEEDVDMYLRAVPAAMGACGAACIEGVGVRYLSCFHGSYSGALGLDVNWLHETLKQFSF